MSTFKSEVTVNQTPQVVYNFLTDFNNHRYLMPDSIQDWTSTEDTAAFNIPNMGKLSLKFKNRVQDEQLVIIPAAKAPVELELNWTLAPSEKGTKVTFVISAELNMMLKMVASGPLQKLADHETAALVSKLS